MEKNTFTPLIIFILLFSIDRITKTTFLILSKSKINTGSLFGLFQNNNLLLTFLTIIAIIILISLLAWNKKHILQISIILSGLLSNLLDRIFYSGVIDFIDIKIWPVFNLADSYIVIGVVLLIYKILKEHD
jgi:signal peptidase II